ncbi:MAG: chemotaxis protein CheW [Gammaproteobacteria bacterium]|nr:chemotaxis protein CheW [Gammaproteobacteria bacterium]
MDKHLINDCWNKTGVWGTEIPRCIELEKYIHCSNCPVYSEAGRKLLERELLETDYLEDWTKNLSLPREEIDSNLVSILVFRLGDEWFALPSQLIREITHCDKHHSLPHRKSPVLRGLVNVRGELLLCVSLGYLFKLHRGEKTYDDKQTPVHERYIVINKEDETYTFPASEVKSILRYDPDDLQKNPSTLNKASVSYVKGVINSDGINIGLLDSELVFHALRRNI